MVHGGNGGTDVMIAIPEFDERANTSTLALLCLVCAADRCGEFISTAANSRTSGISTFAGRPGYPAGRKPAEVHAMMLVAESLGLVKRLAHWGADRKPRQRWHVAPAACGRICCPAGAASPLTLTSNDDEPLQVRPSTAVVPNAASLMRRTPKNAGLAAASPAQGGVVACEAEVFGQTGSMALHPVCSDDQPSVGKSVQNCLAAFGFEVPDDGLMHGFPYQD